MPAWSCLDDLIGRMLYHVYTAARFVLDTTRAQGSGGSTSIKSITRQSLTLARIPVEYSQKRLMRLEVSYQGLDTHDLRRRTGFSVTSSQART